MNEVCIYKEITNGRILDLGNDCFHLVQNLFISGL
jgi:hypothetical protein